MFAKLHAMLFSSGNTGNNGISLYWVTIAKGELFNLAIRTPWNWSLRGPWFWFAVDNDFAMVFCGPITLEFWNKAYIDRLQKWILDYTKNS